MELPDGSLVRQVYENNCYVSIKSRQGSFPKNNDLVENFTFGFGFFSHFGYGKIFYGHFWLWVSNNTASRLEGGLRNSIVWKLSKALQGVFCMNHCHLLGGSVNLLHQTKACLTLVKLYSYESHTDEEIDWLEIRTGETKIFYLTSASGFKSLKIASKSFLLFPN